ncbi:MAG: MBOAT family O-acyltransferase [Lachnospiraceae bacterium]|nr:MBOAT family O-acyltransferase [Lachnospiraceae bacterium]
MTFLSGMFPIFLICTVVLYFLVPLAYRWGVLLAASLIFYVSAGLEKLPFLLVTALVVYGAARWIDFVYESRAEYIREYKPDRGEKKRLQQQDKKKCRRILNGALIIVIGLLVYCKAGARAAAALSSVFSEGRLDWFRVIVPLGISYYTFSAVGYLADIYWKREKAEKNFFKMVLFLAYFPQILQGPIARHRQLANQLVEGHSFDVKRISYGLQLALWGYFKKLVIADRLIIFINTVFQNFWEYRGIVFIVAVLLSGLQLYCDFSGCMDIARGISQVFGIELEKNFDHPFFARSAAEFWRRWHITLGAWFKDYVYMPLVISPRVTKLSQSVKKTFGVRAGRAVAVVIPLGCVWILTGLWHGTGYNYIAWGVYWGAIIIFSAVFAPEIEKLTGFLRINTKAESWKVLQMVRTYLLFSFGRLLTVPGSLHATWEVIRRTLSAHDIWSFFDGSLLEYGLDAKDFVLLAFTVLILWGVSMLQEKGSVRERIAGYNLAVRWGIYYMAIFSVVIFGVYGPGYNSSAFLYMGF